MDEIIDENSTQENREDYGFGKCPECGSSKYIDVTNGESCDSCGYFVYYP